MTTEKLPILAILGGTGDLGTGLARRWVQAGYQVIIGSRTHEKAEVAASDLREVMAERGRETLRFGPMKPVGLTNPHQPQIKAHAVVQLRRENDPTTLYNMVGFQTRLKWGEQKRIFRMIPSESAAALK